MKPTIQATQQKHINELEKENELLHSKNNKLTKQLQAFRNKVRRTKT